MKKVNFVKATNADVVNAAKAAKSNFSRSRFTNGLVLHVTGFDWVSKDDDASSAYPVLTTSLNGQPFDNIFLSTLVRPDQDENGTDVSKTGNFNTLAINAGVSATNDEIWLQTIINNLAGRQVKVVRSLSRDESGNVRNTIKYGRIVPLQTLNFDIVLPIPS